MGQNRFGEAIGIWELDVNGVQLKIRPRMGDNYKLTGIISGAKKHMDQGQMFKEVGVFIKDLVLRDYPDTTPEEKEQLDMVIEFNIAHLLKEMMIAFRWTSREKYDQLEKEELKKGEALTP